MATTACFIIVSRNDIPIYEAEVGVAAKVRSFHFLVFFCEVKSSTFHWSMDYLFILLTSWWSL